MSVWPVASHTRTPLGTGIIGSSGPERVQNAPQRLGIHVAIDADAASAAKLDLDDAALAATSARRRRWRRSLNGGWHGSSRNDLDRDQLR